MDGWAKGLNDPIYHKLEALLWLAGNRKIKAPNRLALIQPKCKQNRALNFEYHLCWTWLRGGGAGEVGPLLCGALSSLSSSARPVVLYLRGKSRFLLLIIDVIVRSPARKLGACVFCVVYGQVNVLRASAPPGARAYVDSL